VGPPDSTSTPHEPDLPRGNTLRIATDLGRGVER